MDAEQQPNRISFHFHPNDQGGQPWCVEKEEEGRRRRYLEGIASGLVQDGAGERMTEKAITSFHAQAGAGDVLLYAGKHGADFTDDIGKLVFSEIAPSADWVTKFRLYDEQDKMGATTDEKCDKVWRQMNGLPPYTKPKQKGFSVEGVIPDGGLKTVDGTGRRVMDEVDLDGVWLVSRPAYTDSIARAVYKALGLMLPSDMRSGLRHSLREKINDKNESDDYYEQYYLIQSALDEKVHQVMNLNGPERTDMLRTLFVEYGDLMVELIMRSEGIFEREQHPDGVAIARETRVDRHQVLLNRLASGASLLQKALATRDRMKQ